MLVYIIDIRPQGSCIGLSLQIGKSMSTRVGLEVSHAIAIAVKMANVDAVAVGHIQDSPRGLNIKVLKV